MRQIFEAPEKPDTGALFTASLDPDREIRAARRAARISEEGLVPA